MIQNKRDFQKVISAIRKEMGGGEYPKAMCTGQQMEKRTATVNCGGEWCSSKSAETAQQVMENMKFVDFCVAHKAKARYEQVGSGLKKWTQIRLTFEG